jgi:predicted nucleic acid-binding protein
MILVDAGPLVAIIHADDRHHQECKEALTKIRGSLATVWPVFVEAMYLLNFSFRAQEALWKLLESGALRLMPLDQADAARMRELMSKYRDLPMDLADAALVHVAEREGFRTVFTLDRRDFSVYRVGRERFKLVP